MKKILALGADIKNRIVFGQGDSIFFGPDTADLSQAGNLTLFKQQVIRVVRKIKPDIIACDLHPGYFSTRFAQEINLQLKAYSLKLIQHHHAHIASVMQEHKLQRPVIGVCFDGTGFGQDGHSWGGEFLLVKRSGFKRLAHLKYRMMPGADQVAREPWRMLVSIFGQDSRPFLSTVPGSDQELVLKMLSKKINSPLSSSAGRLFDAAAAVLGITLFASSEAEGPIKLEAICEQQINQGYYFQLNRVNGCLIIDSDGLFSGMRKDLQQKKAKGIIAAKFHNSMVEIIVSTSKKLAKSLRVKDIALSGGVFQNNFLRNKVIQQLQQSGFNVFTNTHTPVNDLNIALGQYYVSGYTGKS